MEAKFAKLREERAKKTGSMDCKMAEDVLGNMTQEEIDFYRSLALKSVTRR